MLIKGLLKTYYNILEPLVERVVLFLNKMGFYLFFVKEVFSKIVAYSPNYREIYQQIHYIGTQSIFVVSITGIFVGAIVTMNLQLQLDVFGAENFIGGLNVSFSFRELTPLLISFIIASKVGVYTTAELGAMKLSDEIESLKALAIDPIRYLIVPRFLGVFISSFSLLIFGLFMSFIGGLFAAVSLDVNPIIYVKTIPLIVSGYSFVYALIKCLVFGFLVASIGCYMGYNAEGGSEGLARTTRLTSEVLIVSLIFIDYILAMLVNFILNLI